MPRGAVPRGAVSPHAIRPTAATVPALSRKGKGDPGLFRSFLMGGSRGPRIAGPTDGNST